MGKGTRVDHSEGVVAGAILLQDVVLVAGAGVLAVGLEGVRHVEC